MSRIVRLVSPILSLLVVLVLFWLLTPAIASAGAMLGSNNVVLSPAGSLGFIGQAQGDCTASITVSSTGDSGPNTLRQALVNVCNGGTINFAASLANQTITLTSGQLSITKTVTITNSNAPNLKVSGNNVSRTFYIRAGAAVTISHLSIISGTDYHYGGGIYNGGSLSLNNTIFKDNYTSRQGDGGAIHSIGTLTVNNSIFVNNQTRAGGGIYNGGPATISNSTFKGNSAGIGGGIYVQANVVAVNNSTFNGNSAYFGGGIFNDQILIVNNSTFNGNSEGNITNLDSLYLYNSILMGSLTEADCYVIGPGAIWANVNNLIEDGSCNPALSGDPHLGPLTDNGGSTLTHALLPGSPALNAGDNATCLATDQRGIARPQQDRCDIGAFEARGFTLAISGGNHQSAPFGASFPIPLALTITSDESVDGGQITFTAPTSGPSLTLAPTTTVIISGNAATLNVSANGSVGGPYDVVASVTGGNSVTFSLTNTLRSTSTVRVTSASNPSIFGQLVTFTATVSGEVGLPTGSITFVIDGTPQAPVNLAGGKAIFTIAALAVGNHTISANYNGDSNFNSSSGFLVGGQTVKPNPIPIVQFAQAVYTATEGVNSGQQITLTRSGNLANASQVRVNLSGGTASGGPDYSTADFPKTITFGSGVASQTVSINFTDDALVEPTETISLSLTSLSNALIGGQSSVMLRLEDNDAASASSEVYLPLIIK